MQHTDPSKPKASDRKANSYRIVSRMDLLNRYGRVNLITMHYKGKMFNITPVIFRMMQGDMCAAMRQLDKTEEFSADDRFDILCKIHRTFIKYEQI